MNDPLVINAQLTIPASELQFTFARSAGPGGQNVNKVNTKAVLRWNLAASLTVPQAVRERFMSRFSNRVTTAGEVILASDQHRHRARNIGECRERLRAMLLAVASPPRRRRPTRVPRGANEARLKHKRQHAQKKKDRRGPIDE